MNEPPRAGTLGRVNTPRTLRPVALLSVIAFAGVAAACGGKVDFVTGSTGTGMGGDGGGRSTGASMNNSTGSGLIACLPELNGGGPLGPPTITGSKCFDRDLLPAGKPCPETVVAGGYIPVDSCYLLESVDDPCQPESADQCCYNVTEALYCK